MNHKLKQLVRGAVSPDTYETLRRLARQTSALTSGAIARTVLRQTNSAAAGMVENGLAFGAAA
jgi:hypothetical protein